MEQSRKPAELAVEMINAKALARQSGDSELIKSTLLAIRDDDQGADLVTGLLEVNVFLLDLLREADYDPSQVLQAIAEDAATSEGD